MITETEIYWITRLDSLQILPILLAIPFIVAGIGIWVSGDKVHTNLLRASKYWFIGFCIGFLLVFIPTTKEMCAIKAIPMIANNEQVQELPNKVVELANEWIEELKPNKNNERN